MKIIRVASWLGRRSETTNSRLEDIDARLREIQRALEAGLVASIAQLEGTTRLQEVSKVTLNELMPVRTRPLKMLACAAAILALLSIFATVSYDRSDAAQDDLRDSSYQLLAAATTTGDMQAANRARENLDRLSRSDRSTLLFRTYSSAMLTFSSALLGGLLSWFIGDYAVRLRKQL